MYVERSDKTWLYIVSLNLSLINMTVTQKLKIIKDANSELRNVKLELKNINVETENVI